MPIVINHEKYARAQRLLAEGTWQADVERGVLVGPRGKPLRGTSKGYTVADLPVTHG